MFTWIVTCIRFSPYPVNPYRRFAIAMNIKIYQDENGNNPYLRWLKKLKDRQAQLKIEKRLAQLRLERFRQSTKIWGGLSEWLAKQ